MPSTRLLAPCSTAVPASCICVSVKDLKVLKTEKWLQLVSTNHGWQSSSHLCGYIVARFIFLLTFFRCKPLHCISYVATRNPAVCWNICFERIRCIAPKYGRILRDGSKVPHRWFIDPTHVGPMSQKKIFFSNQIFSHFQKLYPTDFLYVDRGRNDYYSCKFWSSEIC